MSIDNWNPHNTIKNDYVHGKGFRVYGTIHNTENFYYVMNPFNYENW